MTVVFTGEFLPSHVKGELIRYPVRPFVPRITQCSRCWAVGPVVGICNEAEVCSRCVGSHGVCNCTSESAKSVNCHGDHDTKFKECPSLKREAAVLKTMARNNSTRREASSAIRRKRFRRRRRNRSKRHRAVSRFSQPYESAQLPPTEFRPPRRKTDSDPVHNVDNEVRCLLLPGATPKPQGPGATSALRVRPRPLLGESD